jgi:potassium-transporting ATPase ATP-binding subunit
MKRLLQHHVLAMSGPAVEAAGRVNMLLLGKTGTSMLSATFSSRSWETGVDGHHDGSDRLTV